MARSVEITIGDWKDFARNEYTLTFKGVTIEEVVKLLAFSDEAADALIKIFHGGDAPSAKIGVVGDGTDGD